MATYLTKYGLDQAPLAQEYLQTVRTAGLKGAVLPAGKVEVLESIQMKCQIPLCEHYGWRVCPPNLPPLAVFRRALADYEAVFVVVLEVPLAEVRGHEPDLRLDDFLQRSEGWALGKGCYWAFGLGSRSCYRCKRCDLSSPCPRPYVPRPSPEAMGIDITYLAREAGLPLHWPLGDDVTYYGLFFL
jgi:predicted metal-binding protein